MTRIPQLKPREIEKILLYVGFKFIRQRGSHKLYRKNKLRVTIPYHNKPLKKGTLASIIKQSGLTTKELTKLL